MDDKQLCHTKGAFTFSFFALAEWRQVVVDNPLPTWPHNQLFIFIAGMPMSSGPTYLRRPTLRVATASWTTVYCLRHRPTSGTLWRCSLNQQLTPLLPQVKIFKRFHGKKKVLTKTKIFCLWSYWSWGRQHHRFILPQSLME
jgi:hypothetical protein